METYIHHITYHLSMDTQINHITLQISMDIHIHHMGDWRLGNNEFEH